MLLFHNLFILMVTSSNLLSDVLFLEVHDDGAFDDNPFPFDSEVTSLWTAFINQESSTSHAIIILLT